MTIRDTAYLSARFHELFPKCSSVVVDHDDELEHINVAVWVHDDDNDTDDVIGYTAVIGSDDDGYVFEPNSPWEKTHPIIKLPLMPSED